MRLNIIVNVYAKSSKVWRQMGGGKEKKEERKRERGRGEVLKVFKARFGQNI